MGFECWVPGCQTVQGSAGMASRPTYAYPGGGGDPTIALVNALNRLAAAIERHNENCVGKIGASDGQC